ncbi:MAG: AzlC family ABC transporter permease [Spirochaetaceae bacterium]|nr:AzlC family ABC transporter permease [Spirochaetaceae bacterium]
MRSTTRNAAGGVLPAAFRASLPVLLGYTTIGLAFGLVLVGAGLPWWLSPLMALVVYAGAAQFMGVGLVAGGAGLAEIGLLTLLMNARHAVYGLSLLGKFSGAGRLKPYLVFGLTDETYGLLTTVEPPRGADPIHFYAALTALDQCYWFLGCLAGAILGAALPFDTTGLDFALTALFVVLLVEQIRAQRRPEPYLAALAAGALAYFLVDPRDFLLASLALAIGGLLLLRGRLGAAGAAGAGAASAVVREGGNGAAGGDR